jgi:electron transport complex protein RnfD
MAFAIVITKHSYGGLGFNLFNPAMAGYALLLIALPVEMTHWTAPDTSALSFADAAATIFTGALPAQQHWDAVTMATPFDAMKGGLQSGAMMDEIVRGPAFDTLSGKGWQWMSIGALIGGIWLLILGVIRWHIPASMLATIGLLAAATYADDPGANGGILFHLLNGGTMLGAFFIATDPVSAATSKIGRLIYGAGIGFLTFIIRKWGNYPDGVAFAVLMMNFCAPLIDRYTVPRIYGHRARQPAP